MFLIVYLLWGFMVGQTSYWIHNDLLGVPLEGAVGFVFHFSLGLNILVPGLWILDRLEKALFVD